MSAAGGAAWCAVKAGIPQSPRHAHGEQLQWTGAAVTSTWHSASGTVLQQRAPLSATRARVQKCCRRLPAACFRQASVGSK